jgi:hypothetical protein
MEMSFDNNLPSPPLPPLPSYTSLLPPTHDLTRRGSCMSPECEMFPDDRLLWERLERVIIDAQSLNFQTHRLHMRIAALSASASLGNGTVSRDRSNEQEKRGNQYRTRELQELIEFNRSQTALPEIEETITARREREREGREGEGAGGATAP